MWLESQQFLQKRLFVQNTLIPLYITAIENMAGAH